MARHILYHKKKDLYMIWSTVVDAPISWPMTLDELKAEWSSEISEQRLQRAQERGTSSMLDGSMEATMEYNRAGPNETHMNPKSVWNFYAKERKHIEQEEG